MTTPFEVRDESRNVHAKIIGWRERRSEFPAICTQICKCDSVGHKLMFRGEKELKYRPELFTIGLKARPLYYGGDPQRLSRNANALAKDSTKFEELAIAFAESPMVKRLGGPTASGLVQLRKQCPPNRRMRLSQLLLYGLHWQNSHPELDAWRDHLFVRACTLDERIALAYALSRRPSEPSPEEAYVVEYAPPCSQGHFENLNTVLAEFDNFNGMQLCSHYPDRDTEVLVPYALLPHYILGYSHLRLLDTTDDVAEYRCEYVPNPAFTCDGATLEQPKDLTVAQTEAMRRLEDQLAWAFHMWTDDGGMWFKIEHKTDDIDVSGLDLDND